MKKIIIIYIHLLLFTPVWCNLNAKPEQLDPEKFNSTPPLSPDSMPPLSPDSMPPLSPTPILPLSPLSMPSLSSTTVTSSYVLQKQNATQDQENLIKQWKKDIDHNSTIPTQDIDIQQTSNNVHH